VHLPRLTLSSTHMYPVFHLSPSCLLPHIFPPEYLSPHILLPTHLSPRTFRPTYTHLPCFTLFSLPPAHSLPHTLLPTHLMSDNFASAQLPCLTPFPLLIFCLTLFSPHVCPAPHLCPYSFAPPHTFLLANLGEFA